MLLTALLDEFYVIFFSGLTLSLILLIEVMVSIIANGDFESAIEPWGLCQYGAGNYSLDIEATEPLQGDVSAKITIHEGGLSWHLQAGQITSSHANHSYTLRYSLRANRDAIVTVGLQQTEHPFGFSYLETHLLLAEQPLQVDTPAKETLTNFRTFTLLLGDVNAETDILIDNVSLIEHAP